MARVISSRLQQVAAGAEVLWSAGRTTLARGLEAATKAMAQALHHIAAARETMAAVHIRENNAVLQGTLDQARDDLAAGHVALDEEQVDSLRDDLAAVRAAADVVDRAAEPAEVAERAQPRSESLWSTSWPVIDQASEQLTTPQSAQAVASIAAELGRIGDAIPSVEQAAETAMLGAMKDAYSQANVDIAEAPADETPHVDDLQPPMLRPQATGQRVISGQRLDQLAYQYYGEPAFWRLLALFNDVDHPLHLPTGMVLRVPPSSIVRYTSDARADNGDRTQIG